jgi:membrane protease YdiL (CAAX protease family)
LNAVPARWGAPATVLWSAAVMAVFFAVQWGFAMVFMSATMARVPPERVALELGKLALNGDVVAVSTILSTPACLLALFIAVKLRRGATLDDMLALRLPPLRMLATWLLAAVAFAALSDALTVLLGKPVVPEFMKAVYKSADNRGLLWIAFVVAAPVFEELLFRGFILTGLASTRIGPRGAVIVASVAWALIHTQYDLYGVATILAMGLLFGWARVKTDSVVTPLAMHMAANLIATIEAAVL